MRSCQRCSRAWRSRPPGFPRAAPGGSIQSPRSGRNERIWEVRLDVWLDVACLFKTRSEAKKACEGGKIDVNGATAKPHRTIRPGDELEISRPFGRKQKIVVRALADQHLARAEAKKLYEDLTPQPTPEEVEMRRM